jgi:hypothetical protein
MCFPYASALRACAWSFSADSGTSRIRSNCSAYHFCSSITVTGVSNGEAGLTLDPWWFPEAGGRFGSTLAPGIACFDSRLPFYSFTVNHRITYVRSTTVGWNDYLPHRLSMVGQRDRVPGHDRLEHLYSQSLSFDQGNASGDPPHGQWSALVPTTRAATSAT